MATGAASTPDFSSGNSQYSAHRRRSRRNAARLLDSHLIRASMARREWRIACLISSKGVDSTWVEESDSIGEFGGWIIVKNEEDKKSKILGFPHLGRLKPFAVGASAALILAAFFHFSLSKKGLNFHFGVRFPFTKESSQVDDDEKPEIFPEETPVPAEDAFPSTLSADVATSGAKKPTVPVEADSTQKQALFDLTKLNIIEDNVKPDELCTRREYARWLVKMNYLLERSPRHKIVLSGLTGVSSVPAFDDISADDQDFIFIQALAETGIVPSKLSEKNRDRLEFFPERLLSRLDLINWRAQLEHLPTVSIEAKMLRKNLRFTDLDSVVTDASSALFTDLLVDEKSIVRKVFGNSRRLQPDRPATNAQAAVALFSGRMATAIQTELSKREMEELARVAQVEDIRREMISSRSVLLAWEGKFKREKARRVEILKDYRSTVSSLEEEKLLLKNQVTRHVKEWAALDCQRQLLVRLKEDIDQLRSKLADERTELATVRESLLAKSAHLRRQQDVAAEAKSMLEVEKEALRILRCWVEEEARKNQVRAKVLESAVQRWRWQGKDSRTDDKDEFQK